MALVELKTGRKCFQFGLSFITCFRIVLKDSFSPRGKYDKTVCQKKQLILNNIYTPQEIAIILC